MSRGHHFTHCQYCNREYVCGDCITSDCEMGHDRKSCEHFKRYLAHEGACAVQLRKLAEGSTGKASAGARLLAQHAASNVVKHMSNGELAEALLETVWANASIGTVEEVILAESIERLKAK